MSDDLTDTLSELVARADPSLVLPVRSRAARVDVPGPLRVLAALDLAHPHAVAVIEDGDGDRWGVPLILEGEQVRRSMPGDGTAQALVARLGHGEGGEIRLHAFHSEQVTGETSIEVDQTNESVVVGHRAIVKWNVRLSREGEPTGPAPTRLTALIDARFEAMPALWGLVEHDAGLLATVMSFLPDAEDGWDWAVSDVRSLASGNAELAQSLEGPIRIGQLCADLHAGLLSLGREPYSPADAARRRQRALDDLDEAVRTVDGDEGARLRARAPALALLLARVGECHGSPAIAIHGDCHVGQVLRHGPEGARQYVVVDFDGNPVLTPAERLQRQPAAVDVAGMLASLDHVGRVVLHSTTDESAEAVVRSWIAAAQAAFLSTYRERLVERGLADLLDESLLVPLRAHQEVREYLYAVRHLPHWVYVPDAALADLLDEAAG